MTTTVTISPEGGQLPTFVQGAPLGVLEYSLYHTCGGLLIGNNLGAAQIQTWHRQCITTLGH